MPTRSVSVCFPAYNEEADIRRVIEEAARLLKDSDLDYEMIVCDDGSSDRTGEIVDELEKNLSPLRVHHNRPNRGMRATWEFLYHEARKDFVFLNPADGQWPTACLFDLLPLTDEYDVVVASRRDKHYGPLRALVSSGYNWLTRAVFGVDTFDAGAIKLVRREIIGRFALVSRSPFTEAERMIRAARAGYRIAAVPTETRPRAAGEAGGVKPGLLVEALVDVARVWWDLRQP